MEQIIPAASGASVSVAPSSASIVPSPPKPNPTIVVFEDKTATSNPVKPDPTIAVVTSQTQRLPHKLLTQKSQMNDDRFKHGIDPTLLVPYSHLTYERDSKGDRRSLGRGAFGNVLVANYLGSKIVVKEINAKALKKSENVDRFLLELKLIGRLRHPNVVQCLGVVWEGEERGIMFELCSRGSLNEYITNFPHQNFLTWNKSKAAESAMKKQFLADIMKGDDGDRQGRDVEESISSAHQMEALKGFGLKSRWALDIARGCAFLHGQSPPIIHRDLKCANILVTGDLKAKVTDFGESRTFDAGEKGTMTTVGTPYFMAPEVFSDDTCDKRYTAEVDCYSFGMLLLEIFLNANMKKAFHPGWGPIIIMNRISKGWRPDLTAVEGEDQDLAGIIRNCWQANPKLRPTMVDLLGIFEKKVEKRGD